MERTIPIFPCQSLDEALDFYETLGFEVSYRQDEPYLYAAVNHGDIILHLSKLSMWGTKHAVSLVFVPNVAKYHQQFADALRQSYGKVPTTALPRISRHRFGQTRFHIFDPSGNVMIFIDQKENDSSYRTWNDTASPLEQALENAIFLRDTYVNDKAAASVLDRALERHPAATAIERARVLAARAEIALAMGDRDLSRQFREQLDQIALSDGESEQYADELQAAEMLEQWIGVSDET